MISSEMLAPGCAPAGCRDSIGLHQAHAGRVPAGAWDAGERVRQRRHAVISIGPRHQRRLRLARLRRELREQGFALRRARWCGETTGRTRHEYRIFDHQHQELVPGARFATLADVEAWIEDPET